MRPLTSKGLTIIELIMVITIVGILTAVSSLYIKETIDLWLFLSFRSEAVAQGRAALLRMEREIRQIKNDVSVYTAEPTRFRFDDINNLNIDYQLSGSNLTRNADILASGVSALAFTYYDNNNQVIANPDVSPNPTNIKRININVTAQSGAQSKTLNTQVYPRNL
jgi:prepilin-type N-terminal cleavage/methylation domain-containing protein